MGMRRLFLLCLLLSEASATMEIAESSSSSSSSCSARFFEDHLASGRTSGHILALHHAHGPCSPLNLPTPTASELLHHDKHRSSLLTSRLLSNATLPRHHLDLLSSTIRPSSIGVPLTSGVSLGVGNYVARIGIGTPSRDYIVVVDTGSSLSWLQCAPCKVSCYPQKGPVFNPESSRTYKPVPCSTPECEGLEATTLNPSACSQMNVCIYEASYGDSSFSVGYLGRDSLSFGKTKLSSSFVYGCGQDNAGLFGRAAGIIGLANNNLSLLGQLGSIYGRSFSYCLPTTSSAGYLSIGSTISAKYTFTPFVPGSLDKSLYSINLVGITVGEKLIPVPVSAYSSAPTIIDSGTVITRLPAAVYTGLSNALLATLSKHPRAPAYSILATCFKGSFTALPVPPVSLVFAGGAKLALSAHNVFYDIRSNGITCLAFAESSGVTIIGNRQQQTFNVAYDVAGARIGFAAGGCR